MVDISDEGLKAFNDEFQNIQFSQNRDEAELAYSRAIKIIESIPESATKNELRRTIDIALRHRWRDDGKRRLGYGLD